MKSPQNLIRYFLITFIGVFFYSSSLLSIQTISLEQLTDNPSNDQLLFSFQNQLVEVRGFWYPISSELGILSAQPNMKSCCLAKSNHLHQQLFVKGADILQTYQKVVTLEGIFKIDPLFNQKGELIQLFVLEQPREVERSHSSALVLIEVIVIGFCMILSLNFLLKRFIPKKF